MRSAKRALSWSVSVRSARLDNGPGAAAGALGCTGSGIGTDRHSTGFSVLVLCWSCRLDSGMASIHLVPATAQPSAADEAKGLWLGLLGVVIFAMTLPMTRLAVG